MERALVQYFGTCWFVLPIHAKMPYACPSHEVIYTGIS